MGRLVCASIGSLDSFIVDADGYFDWSAPDEEVHAYLNDGTGRLPRTSTAYACTR